MLLQKCQITYGNNRVYIKGFQLDGKIEYTDSFEEAIVWPAHFWDLFIGKMGLNQHSPLLITVDVNM